MILIFAALSGGTEFKMSVVLSAFFSDGMVLQRDKEISVYGRAGAGETVSVCFLGGEYSCKAGEDGKFEIAAGTYPAGGPYEMTVTSGGGSVTISDILIGDVWLCGGQSNMEFMLERCKHFFPDVMENDSYPEIRQFVLPKNPLFGTESDEVSAGKWEAAVNENLSGFTAAGYFFAKRIYEKYKIPIGLYASAVGGTPIAAWMSEKMLSGFPEELSVLEDYKDEGFVSELKRKEKEYADSYYSGVEDADIGIKEGWDKPDFDDGGWDKRELTEQLGGELSKPGVIWFRKTVEIPEKLWGKPAMIFMGTAIDADKTYINGEFVGETTYRYPPREYHISALPEKKCVIAVKLYNRYGGGGFVPCKPHYIISEGKAINLDGEWKYRRSAETAPHIEETFFDRIPSGLYNSMTAPLLKQKIKGVIWYQGESDARNPEPYSEKFKTLINGWRENWGYDFPFLFVELPFYFDETDWEHVTDGWESLRKNQREALSLKYTGMAFSADVGEYNDIHPQNKQTVGYRLAGVAFRVAYGEKLPPSPFEIVGEID